MQSFLRVSVLACKQRVSSCHLTNISCMKLSWKLEKFQVLYQTRTWRDWVRRMYVWKCVVRLDHLVDHDPGGAPVASFMIRINMNEWKYAPSHLGNGAVVSLMRNKSGRTLLFAFIFMMFPPTWRMNWRLFFWPSRFHGVLHQTEAKFAPLRTFLLERASYPYWRRPLEMTVVTSLESHDNDDACMFC